MEYLQSQRLGRWISAATRLNTIVLFVSGFVVQVGIMALFAMLWWNKEAATTHFNSGPEQFILLVILAPISETLIFQYCVIDFVLDRFKSEALAILFSALGFSLIHLYSVQYFVATFFSGLLFAFLYIVLRRKRSSPIIFITILHALFNGFVWWMRP